MAERSKLKIPDIDFQPRHALSDGIELCTLESLYKRAPKFDFDPFSPHRVGFNHLIYIRAGVGAHFVDFDRYSYRAGSFIFVDQNQVHAFDGSSFPEGLLVLYTREFLEVLRVTMRVPSFASGFYQKEHSPVLTVGDELKESCEALLTEIGRVNGDERHDRQIIQFLFAALLIKLDRERSDVITPKLNEENQQRLAQFLSLLESNFTQKHDATIYAELMGVTYKTLHQICTAAFQKTPKQLIDARTVLEAKRRIAIEGIQITQLAYELGFGEVGNFTKFFKKHEGVTPNDFRRNVDG